MINKKDFTIYVKSFFIKIKYKVGKIIMEIYKYPLLIADCVVVKDNMYFFSQNYNALCSLNIEKKECILLGRIPNEYVFDENLVEAIHYFKNTLILTPKRMTANKVWIYDLTSKKWTFIELDFGNVVAPLEKIAYSVIYNETLVLVGCYYNGIIKIDLNTKKIEYYKDIFDTEEMIHSLFNCEMVKDNLLIPSPNKNQIIKVNLTSYNCETISVASEKCTFVGICKCNEKYWIAPRKKSPYVVLWNGENKYQEYEVPSEIKKNGEYVFAKVGYIGDKIYMSGGRNKKTLVFSSENYNEQQIINNSFVIIKGNGENYILQDYRGNVLYVANGKKYEFCMKKTIKELGVNNIDAFLKKELIYEDNNVNLLMLIETIAES